MRDALKNGAFKRTLCVPSGLIAMLASSDVEYLHTNSCTPLYYVSGMQVKIDFFALAQKVRTGISRKCNAIHEAYVDCN